MRYSIILSIDCEYGCLNEYRPKLKTLYQTEGDDQGEYDHIWKRSQHRKLAGVVTQRGFDSIVRKCELSMSEIDTMGMIGAPHLNCIGWSPAFSFDSMCDSDAIINAYVCPLPNKKEQRKFPLTQEGWDKIKEHLLEQYP